MIFISNVELDQTLKQAKAQARASWISPRNFAWGIRIVDGRVQFVLDFDAPAGEGRFTRMNTTVAMA